MLGHATNEALRHAGVEASSIKKRRGPTVSRCREPPRWRRDDADERASTPRVLHKAERSVRSTHTDTPKRRQSDLSSISFHRVVDPGPPLLLANPQTHKQTNELSALPRIAVSRVDTNDRLDGAPDGPAGPGGGGWGRCALSGAAGAAHWAFGGTIGLQAGGRESLLAPSTVLASRSCLRAESFISAPRARAATKTRVLVPVHPATRAAHTAEKRPARRKKERARAASSAAAAGAGVASQLLLPRPIGRAATSPLAGSGAAPSSSLVPPTTIFPPLVLSCHPHKIPTSKTHNPKKQTPPQQTPPQQTTNNKQQTTNNKKNSSPRLRPPPSARQTSSTAAQSGSPAPTCPVPPTAAPRPSAARSAGAPARAPCRSRGPRAPAAAPTAYGTRPCAGRAAPAAKS